ncbi:MAG: DHH family phosphoesterase [Deltaproteobacteria bacterium]|nr:DHH family phosphoesterase [Deltaproteobacteria bacterium]
MNNLLVWKRAINIIEKSEKVLVICHFNPDTDAYGSLIAMGLFLDDKGIKYDLAFDGALENKYTLINFDYMINRLDAELITVDAYNSIIILDTAIVKQMGTLKKVYSDARMNSIPIINIDHHKTDDPICGDFNIVDPNASASCEILYDLFLSINHPISPDLAHIILKGIFGDTNILRSHNVTPKTMRITAHLIELGADRMALIEQLNSLDFKTAKIWGKVIETMECITDEKKIVYSIADENIIGKDGEAENALDGITNFMRDLDGVDLAILFIQRKNEVKISFRSKSVISSLLIARIFGGGGHYAAAGCEFSDKTIKDVQKEVLDIVNKNVCTQLKTYKGDGVTR